MSPRKIAPTADTPTLPTIKDYFGRMAEAQAEDIRRLKQSATGKEPAKTPVADKAAHDPWRLHPVRKTKPSAAKRGAQNTTKSASKKAPKKAAKKTAKKARR